ncbi:MAG: hypothetical protein KAT30_05825, partial [Candidatus Krumholzibacteria bacterium]|nr:hypothetical protein [Candidatus Krumholzibacteria bacterium]
PRRPSSAELPRARSVVGSRASEAHGGLPQVPRNLAGRTKTSEGPQRRAGVMEKERRVAWGRLFG